MSTSNLPAQPSSTSHLEAERVVGTLRGHFPRDENHDDSHRVRVQYRIFKACKIILEHSNHLRAIFNAIDSKLQDLEHKRVLRNFENALYHRLEVEGSVGWNYLYDDNWEILEKLGEKIKDKGTKLISTTGGTPHITTRYQVDVLWSIISPTTSSRLTVLGQKRLVLPFKTREKMLEGLFQHIIKRTTGINRPYNQYLFFSYWSEKVGAELKRRYTLDPTILVSLHRWVDLSEGLNWFREHPESEILYDASGNGLYWTFWPADKVTQFVDKILTPREELPGYAAAHSLGSSRRIGIRQFRLQPDLRTFGNARDGGLLF
ncbi:hypothetical protein JCM5350_002945 [Sporobolomyces pararoseus]